MNGARPTHINDRPNGRGSEQPAIRFYPHYFAADQLYNINDDPLERTNRYEEMKGSRLLVTLQDELKRFLEEVPKGFGEFK